MNTIDLLLIFVILYFALEGVKRGFLIQLIDIIGLITSLILSLTLYSVIAGILIKIFNLPQIAANPAGFLIVWVISESTFSILTSSCLSKAYTRLKKNSLNTYFGFLPATINAILFLSFALLFVISLPISPGIKKNIFDSKIGAPLIEGATALEKPLNKVFGPLAKQSLTFLTVKPQDREIIRLGFTQSNLTEDTESQKIMFDLLNKERENLGYQKLTIDENLTRVALKHSEDMFKRGYFSHYSPEGKDVGSRLGEKEVTYSIAGENLAFAPSVQRAHSGLMESEGHKRNILDPAFNKVGIGAIDGGIYGKIFTQVFTN
jgi:uncharacterized protein YkwD